VSGAKTFWSLASFVLVAYAISWGWTFPFVAAGEPDNDVVHRAYAHLRDNLRTERDGQALRLVSGGGGLEQEIDDHRYRLVL
jgi:hypothetical protein